MVWAELWHTARRQANAFDRELSQRRADRDIGTEDHGTVSSRTY
jgi:hypothetical protein